MNLSVSVEIVPNSAQDLMLALISEHSCDAILTLEPRYTPLRKRNFYFKFQCHDVLFGKEVTFVATKRLAKFHEV